MGDFENQITTAVVIFDLDGTLIDSADSILWCLKFALEENCIYPQEPLTKTLIGPPLSAVINTLCGNSDTDKNEDVANLFRRKYDTEGCLMAKPYDGVVTLLSKLRKRGCRIFLATNKRKIPMKRIIEHLGWVWFFEGAYSLDSFDPILTSKSDLIRTVIDLHKIKSSDATYVGDRVEDRHAAWQNSIEYVMVTWGYDFKCS